ncbi:TPM domain-containing protein, partial [Micrococcus sp.]|uniref:TPM domain-containing protein n=1 Tax=Micrococcus sp. TaxID=1271 RepID=UPI0026DD945E
MAHPAARTTPARLSRAVLASGTLGAALVLAPGASAVVNVPPGTFVVDGAGVLSPAQEQQLSQDITRLRTQAGQNLYVVYVDEHPDGVRGIVQDVANSRGLSANDNVPAIEVTERRYGVNTNDRLDPAEDTIDGSYVNPLMLQVPKTGDWLAPAVA